MNRAIVETDNQLVQQALYGADDDRTEFGDIIIRAKSLLLDRPRVKVVFFRRSENAVAHALARKALFSFDVHVGLEKALFSSDVHVGLESLSWLCNTLRVC
ncbi:hypothetical protein LINPERPRIM_LOCUS30645 [Linum perenne]